MERRAYRSRVAAAAQGDISLSHPMSAPERRLGRERLAAVLERAAQLGATPAALDAYLADAGAQPAPDQPGTWRQEWARIARALDRRKRHVPSPYPPRVLSALAETADEHGDTLTDFQLAPLGRLIVQAIRAAIAADPALAGEVRSALGERDHPRNDTPPNGRARLSHTPMTPVRLGGDTR